jgi:glutamate synthase (NADPH) small chain
MAQFPIKIQSSEKRNRNFQEVSLGYPKQVAQEEAKRCLQCSDPVCSRACPLGIDIPQFIRFLREGNITAAYDKIKEKNWLPSVCGRICAAPCEVICILQNEKAPIGVRALERYTADNGRKGAPRLPKPMGRKVAIIGSGPSGLTAAVELARLSYAVTIFEALDKPGGVLRYGIPEFRLPRKILDQEISDLKQMGIEIRTNAFIGQTTTLEELSKEGFVAVLLAMGSGVPKLIDLPGANLGGVYYGEEFLMRVNLNKSNVFAQKSANFFMGGKIVVIGAGNTALDCARVGVRFERDVTLMFRRGEDELLVRRDERDQAKEEGVKLEPLVRPVEIIANEHGFVAGVKCIRLDYARMHEHEPWQLVELPDSSFVLDADTVVIATGHQPNSIVGKLSPQLNLNVDKTIKVDEDAATSLPGIFACGNVTTTAGPVVEAMASGKKAALNIHTFLTK